MASETVTPPPEAPAAPPKARPNMRSLEAFLSGDPPPPRKPIPWVKVIIGSVVAAIVVGILGYYSVLGEQAASRVWLQVGRNLNRSDKPTNAPGGRAYGAPSYGNLVIRNSLVEALEQSL